MRRRDRGKEIKGKETKDEQRCKIYVFAEGSTEEIYLHHFENRTYNVKVIPIPTGHTDALGIVKCAKDYIDKHTLDLELGDRGYCVFDSDPRSNTKLNETFDLLRGYREKGLNVIFSNPSFEVWFVLHFKSAPYGLSAEKMKDEIKKLVRDKFPDYAETTDIYEYLLDKQPEALKRAKLLHRDQEQVHNTVYSHECNPYRNKLFIRLYRYDIIKPKKGENRMENHMIDNTVWEELQISNDFIFGKIMQDPKLCKGLLQRILPDLKIDRIEYPETQKAVRPDIDAKSVRLDVYVEDDKNTVYDIEMQVGTSKELPKRTRYYQSLLDMQMIDKGEPYKKLKPSYIIFICPFDQFGMGRHIYTFENTCKEDNSISLGDGTTKIFLNAKGTMNDVSPELKAFLDYVAGKKPADPFVDELEEAVKNARKNREWRHEYMTLLMRDQENKEIGREEGRKEGKAEGIITIGLDVGLSEDELLSRLQDKLNITFEAAKEYLEKFGN